MIKYAQLGENNVVVGVSFLSGEVDAPDMILLAEDEAVELGMIYDKKNNAWLEGPKEEPAEPEVSAEEKLARKLDVIDMQLTATMAAVVELGMKGGVL